MKDQQPKAPTLVPSGTGGKNDGKAKFKKTTFDKSVPDTEVDANPSGVHVVRSSGGSVNSGPPNPRYKRASAVAGSFSASASASATSSEFKTRSTPKKWYERVHLNTILGSISTLLQRWTTFPMLPNPNIYFGEDEDEKKDKYDAKYKSDGGGGVGDQEAPQPQQQKQQQQFPHSPEHFPGLANVDVELKANYERSTEPLFEAILKFRKETRAAKANYHTMKIEMGKFPEWNDAIVDRMRSTFQVFDLSGDGLVDLRELTTILAEFGDTSSDELRKKFFDDVDNKTGSIDFMQFLTLVYTLTVRSKNDQNPDVQSLAQSFHAIDRNMARIRSLDVVQQLQAGLF